MSDPVFVEVGLPSPRVVANLITFTADDYPAHTEKTMLELQAVVSRYTGMRRAWINSYLLKTVHGNVFNIPSPEWRKTFLLQSGNERVGAIPANIVQEIARLENRANPLYTVRNVKDWYIHFMQIQPFVYGNEVTAGVFLAAASFYLSHYEYVVVDQRWPVIAS